MENQRHLIEMQEEMMVKQKEHAEQVKEKDLKINNLKKEKKKM